MVENLIFRIKNIEIQNPSLPRHKLSRHRGRRVEKSLRVSFSRMPSTPVGPQPPPRARLVVSTRRILFLSPRNSPARTAIWHRRAVWIPNSIGRGRSPSRFRKIKGGSKIDSGTREYTYAHTCYVLMCAFYDSLVKSPWSSPVIGSLHRMYPKPYNRLTRNNPLNYIVLLSMQFSHPSSKRILISAEDCYMSTCYINIQINKVTLTLNAFLKCYV